MDAVLIGLGTVNVLYGAVSALAQRDLKYVVGYSSVSHMGYVLMGIATLDRLGVGGAVLQMFSHGIMTALFFALVGVIYDRAHVRDIGVLGGLSKRMGVTASFFAVAGLASLGLPGLSGFVAEFLVFVGTFRDLPAAGGAGGHRRGYNRRIHPAPPGQRLLRTHRPPVGAPGETPAGWRWARPECWW